jgi:hypothetical protein
MGTLINNNQQMALQRINFSSSGTVGKALSSTPPVNKKLKSEDNSYKKSTQVHLHLAPIEK